MPRLTSLSLVKTSKHHLAAVLFFLNGLLAAQTVVIKQDAATVAATPITISSAAIPAHGSDFTLWNHNNVFSLTEASTYPDSTPGDWTHWVATANDPTTDGVRRYNAQDIILRKTSAVQRISNISYTGVSGPSFSSISIGRASNAYFDWSTTDNDLSSVDFNGNWFAYVGNNPPQFSRNMHSTFPITNCAIGSPPSLIPNCSLSYTVAPGRTGPQNLYVYTHVDGTQARLSVKQGSTSVTQEFNTAPLSTLDERVFTVAINPPNTETTYTITLVPTTIQATAGAAFLAFTATALGGTTPGNISDSVLSTASYLDGQPSHSYGVRVHQLDPAQRVPAPLKSYTLARTDSLNTALRSAACGDAIHLPLGYVSNEQIILPSKPCTDAAWISIVADGAPSLTYGKRANPIDYPGGPTSPALLNYSGGLDCTVANDNSAPIGSHHYILRGMEITSLAQGELVRYNLVCSVGGSTVQSLPNSILFQGVYAHGDVNLTNSIKGFDFNANGSGIYDSYITSFRGNPHSYNMEYNGIYTTTSSGPLTFKNNFISAQTEIQIFGGSVSQPYLIPKDIEITENYYYKPPSYNMLPDDLKNVKNALEFKGGQHVSITRNVFENGFAQSQPGQAIFFRSLTYQGSQPSGTSNALVMNNIIRHHTVGIQLEGIDGYMFIGSNKNTNGSRSCGTFPPPDCVVPSFAPHHFAPTQYDIRITNNVLEDLSYTKYGAATHGGMHSAAFDLGGPIGVNVVIDHNTVSYDSVADGVGSLNDRAVLFSESLLTGADTAALFHGSICDRGLTFTEAANSFQFVNNVVNGVFSGECIGDLVNFGTHSTVSNNVFYGQLQGFVDEFNSGHFLGPNSVNNTATTSQSAPVVAGVGVDRTQLPDYCTVVNGNRPDIPCDRGYIYPTMTLDNVLAPTGGTVSVLVNQFATGLSSKITPTFAGLPPGVSVSFSPNVIPESGGSTTASFNISSSSAPGTFTLTYTATSGGTIATLPLKLTVYSTTIVGNYGGVINSAMNEGTGQTIGNAADSGNSLTGTALTWASVNAAGMAPVFSGSGAGVRAALAGPTTFGQASSFSGCLRINPRSFGNTQNLLGNQDADNGRIGWTFFLGGGAGSNLVFGLLGAGTKKVLTVIGPTIPLNTLTSGCFTYDGSGTASGVKIYLAGVQAPTTIYEDSLGGASIASMVPLSVGAIYSSSRLSPVGQFFTGSLADVYVAPGIFTPSAVATLNAVPRSQGVSSCRFELSGNTLMLSSSAGSFSIAVTTTPACAWSATSSASWLQIVKPGVGSGAATITYTANNTTTPRSGVIDIAGQSVTLTQSAGSGVPPHGPSKVGVMQSSTAAWAIDANGNGIWDVGDRYFSFVSAPGDIAVVGDWNGDGHAKAGVYRNGFWILDMNNNGVYDGPAVDRFIAFGGQPGDMPVVGDWNGDGRTKVGIYRKGFWLLDTNGDGVFDTGDQFLAFGGNPGEQPVIGDWNGDGKTKVGILFNGNWLLDYNGNGVFDAADKFYSFPYAPGDRAVVGDWNGNHNTKIGIYRNGFWLLDYNGNGVWDGVSGGDEFAAFGGNVGETPVLGDWNGDGRTKIGYYVHGFWGLDFNGNGRCDSADRFIALGGQPGEQPVVGAW